jgi:hypothetical protein
VVRYFVGKENGFVVLRGVEDMENVDRFVDNVVKRDISSVRHAAYARLLTSRKKLVAEWHIRQFQTSFRDLINEALGSRRIELKM